jgi:hypothetical protein
MEDGPNHLRLSIQQDPQAAEVMRELGHRMHTRISESTHTHAHNSLKFGISIPIFEHVFNLNMCSKLIGLMCSALFHVVLRPNA